MPKVTLTESQQQRDRLCKNLKTVQGGLRNADMGEIIGKNKDTYRNRLNDPETLTLREVRLLCRKFHIDINRFVTGELTIS